MKSLEEYRAWFRDEAKNLPTDVRRAVLGALEHGDPRQVFLDLNKLWEAKDLPAYWGPMLDEFFWGFCY